MTAFSVFEPPPQGPSPSRNADGYVFLPERFSLGAFLFTPLWMIWRRLWLVLLIYVVGISFVEFGLRLLGTPAPGRSAVLLLLSFLIGLEAADLRRWALTRRGWRDCGVVIADDVEMAERRFFDATMIARTMPRSGPPSEPRSEPRPTGLPGASSVSATAGGPVLGLFPEPGGGR